MKAIEIRVVVLAWAGWTAMGCGGTDVRPPGHDPEAVVMAGALGNRFVRAGEGNEEIGRASCRERV